MRVLARPGWVRRILRPLGAALLCLVPPALAGDRAGIDFFGYSPDLAYFAFEEFGIQDGSGFPYANIYLLDLENDRWVSGSPIRLRLDDEAVSLAEVRARAASEAQPLLAQYGIAEPVDILALNGDGDAAAAGATLSVGRPGYGLGVPDQPFELTLESFLAPGDPACATYTEQPVRGFALTYERDGASHDIHRDTRIPDSRGCALDYRLYGVVAPFDSFAAFNTDPATGLVAIVSVYTLGFEGPDRRFIAVPLGR
jgi:predicted secreted protein